MRIDLIRPDAWDQLCDQYRAALPSQEPTSTVQVYRGFHHALWEATQSLAKIFPHKKSVAIVAQGEPAFDSIAVAFSAEGYTVHLIPGAQFGSPQDWPGGGFAALQNDLLFVLAAEDDPITAELHVFPELASLLKTSRVFSIMVSHASYRFKKPEPVSPFAIRILSLDTDRALLIGGARCKIRPALAPQLAWKSCDVNMIGQDLELVADQAREDLKAAVLRFETNLPAGFHAYFADEQKDEQWENRLFDRAVIYHLNLDGLAIISMLQELNIGRFAGPGEPADFDTMSPCRWESERMVNWLGAAGEASDALRGLVVIEARHLGPLMISALSDTSEFLLKIQNG